MIDNRNNPNCFKQAVCIQTERIYDSCSDKDCLEDLEVLFVDGNTKQIIENSSFVKCKCVEVTNTFFAIEPVPFNKGFFSIDLTFTFNVVLEAYVNASTPPQTVSGTATFTKKVILYGSEGNAKTFSSEDEQINHPTGCGCCYVNLPTATVQIVEPICLDCKLVTKYPCHCDNCCGGCCPSEETGCPPVGTKKVYITIGMFSIVQLQRPVPILVPSYDYCIPHKECTTSSDSPCELFEKIKFPQDEFFPPSLDELESEEDCDCDSSFKC